MGKHQLGWTMVIGASGLALVMLAFLAAAYLRLWNRQPVANDEVAAEEAAPSTTAPDDEDPRWVRDRKRMVEDDLAGRGIRNQKVLAAMGRLRRQEFVSENHRDEAYADRPLPIGHGQTISQPYIVALMTELALPKPAGRVLDVGTGSGYQAAVLGELAKEVYSIEIVKPLAEEARTRLARLGYKNVTVRHGDGYRGWPEHAPFDAIIVAAAPDHVPEPLVEQLAPGGRLVIPVGRFFQELLLIEKQADGTVTRREVAPVAFVPMTGEAKK